MVIKEPDKGSWLREYDRLDDTRTWLRMPITGKLIMMPDKGM
jgi:hypothetical protein